MMLPPEPNSRRGTAGGRTEPEALAKAALRVEMARVRRAIPADERTEMGKLITRSLWSLAELRRAAVVLCFSSFGSEVPTDGLLASLEEAGVTVFLPILDSGEMYVAELRKGDRLVETSYGPREPLSRRPARPSLIEAAVVPGLAFDRGGGRLGYGGGHYDRFLRQLTAGATLIGVAFSEQVVGEVPVGPCDVRLDIVVTDREVIDCRRGEWKRPEP